MPVLRTGLRFIHTAVIATVPAVPAVAAPERIGVRANQERMASMDSAAEAAEVHTVMD